MVKQNTWLNVAVIVVSSVVCVFAGPDARQSQTSAVTRPLLLGVLEQGKAEEWGTRKALGEYRRVRVLFRKTTDGWEAFPKSPDTPERLQAALNQFPAEVSWTIAFDGRQLGPLRSVNPRVIERYMDWGLQQIADGDKVPRIGVASQRFSGFPQEPTYHPLVLVSQPRYEDPDQWKPVSGVVPSPMVIAAFRKWLAKLGDYDTFMTDGKPAHKVPAFTDRDVVVVRAYGSRTGSRLVALALSRKVARWAYDPDVQPWAIEWFVETDRETFQLDEGSAQLVDAGDYDGDGRSELLFFNSSDEHDEYTLWWNDFAHYASFGWIYH